MRPVAALLLLTLCSGCLQQMREERIQAKTQQRLDDARAEWARNRIDLKCQDEPPLQERCGLLTAYFNEPKALDRFQQKVCAGEWNDHCTNKFIDMLAARFAERYSLADPAQVQRRCKGYPEECATLEGIERTWLRSHNAGADNLRAKKEGEAKEAGEAALAEEREASRRALAAALQGAADGFNAARRNRSSGSDDDSDSPKAYRRTCINDSGCLIGERCVTETLGTMGHCMKATGY